MVKTLLSMLWVAWVTTAVVLAQESAMDAPSTLPAVPFAQLSDKNITPEGRRALAIRPDEWKHTETPHFVIHFFHNFIAAPVTTEAEFYYRYIKADLGLTPQDEAEGGTRKAHLYLFETREDWAAFRNVAALEPWTGAVCIDGTLFVPRYPESKWKGNALGHEIVHLMVNRFEGKQSPMWLKEGQAEDVSSRGYSAFNRARGYVAHPLESIPNAFIPLSRLTSFTAYPPDADVETFYRESHVLVAFLSAEGRKPQFLKMSRAMAQGAPFSSALSDAYGSRWTSLDALETAFKSYLETTAGH